MPRGVKDQLSKMERFCDSCHSLLAMEPRRVQKPVRNQRRITNPAAGFCDAPCMGHLLGYASASTTDQQPQLQVDALERTGCCRVFTETASGARSDCPPTASS
jgi:hypothetical protein